MEEETGFATPRGQATASTRVTGEGTRLGAPTCRVGGRAESPMDRSLSAACQTDVRSRRRFSEALLGDRVLGAGAHRPRRALRGRRHGRPE